MFSSPLRSKQRHNKLWRSHSDSDLSDRPEPLCKPSSPLLVRADSHNNNTTTSSPSLHHFLGVAVLQALVAESGSCAKSAGSQGPDTLANGVGEPRPGRQPPLPRPRAATVIPEEKLDGWPSVAVTVPVALPHPPPSLHILPPTPEPQRRRRRAPPAHLSISEKCEPALDLPETRSSEETPPLLTLGSSDSEPLDPASTHPLPLAQSDDNNNPSEPQAGGPLDGRGEANGFCSIDFLSAREKFLGLAQESEQPRSPPPPDGDGKVNVEERKENGTEQVGNVQFLSTMQKLQKRLSGCKPNVPNATNQVFMRTNQLMKNRCVRRLWLYSNIL